MNIQCLGPWGMDLSQRNPYIHETRSPVKGDVGGWPGGERSSGHQLSCLKGSGFRVYVDSAFRVQLWALG